MNVGSLDQTSVMGLLHFPFKSDFGPFYFEAFTHIVWMQYEFANVITNKRIYSLLMLHLRLLLLIQKFAISSH